jgi:hypothetical protein
MQVRIPKCSACGQEHASVEVFTLTTPQLPFTHWYSCPTNGDPVPLALMTAQDQTTQAIHSQILQAVTRCLIAKRWLIAFFRVEGGKVWCDPPQYDGWPDGDFGAAVKLLAETVEKIKPQQTEMPPAPPLLPRVNLFGEQGQN